MYGRPRPMEPPSELEALQLPHHEIGRIKEGPVKRWLLGQEKWDVRFRRTAKRAKRKREKLEGKAEKLFQHLSERRQQGQPPVNPEHTSEDVGIDSREENIRRWGPLDLVEDNPPPSAIVGRRDTVSCLPVRRHPIILDMNEARFPGFDEVILPPRRFSSGTPRGCSECCI